MRLSVRMSFEIEAAVSDAAAIAVEEDSGDVVAVVTAEVGAFQQVGVDEERKVLDAQSGAAVVIVAALTNDDAHAQALAWAVTYHADDDDAERDLDELLSLEVVEAASTNAGVHTKAAELAAEVAEAEMVEATVAVLTDDVD